MESTIKKKFAQARAKKEREEEAAQARAKKGGDAGEKPDDAIDKKSGKKRKTGSDAGTQKKWQKKQDESEDSEMEDEFGTKPTQQTRNNESSAAPEHAQTDESAGEENAGQARTGDAGFSPLPRLENPFFSRVAGCSVSESGEFIDQLARQYCVVNEQATRMSFKGPTQVETQMFKAPRMLPIQLARFKWLKTGAASSKDTSLVSFPLELKMSKFFGECNANGDSEAAENTCAVYDLNGVILHVGNSLNTGHYTSYNKVPETGEWYHFDDGKVHKVDGNVEDVFATQRIREQVYVLMYVRRSRAKASAQ